MKVYVTINCIIRNLANELESCKI